MLPEFPGEARPHVVVIHGNDGSEVRLAKTCRSLSRLGYQVDFVGWDRRPGQVKSIDLGSASLNLMTRQTPYGKATLGGQVRFTVHVLRQLARLRPDIVYCANEDNALGLVLFKGLLFRHLVVDVYDALADRHSGRGVLSRGILSAVAGVVRWRADRLVATDDRRRARFGRYLSKTIVVENVPEDPGPELAMRLPKGDAKVYVGGALHSARGLPLLLDAIDSMQKPAQIVCAGWPYDAVAEAFVADERVDYRGAVSARESLELMAQCDLVFAFYAPTSVNNRFASPNKLHDAMAVGRLIAINSETHVAEIVAREKMGWTFAHDDADGLRRILESLPTRRSELEAFAKKARAWVEAEHNWATMEQRLDGLLLSLESVSYSTVWRTLSHLTIRQLLGQLMVRARARYTNHAGWFRYAVPPFPGSKGLPEGVNPPAPLLDREAIKAGRWRFIGAEETLGFPPRWAPNDVPLLWAFNLHYFHWMHALDFGDAREATLDWIAQKPLERGSAVWHPYVISLRVVNWCLFFFGQHRDETLRDEELVKRLWRSIYLQCEWLVREREVHLMGNHYWENGFCLTVAGWCFAGHAAENWRSMGEAILLEQATEQFDADGMQFERSPMYQARAVWTLETLAAIDPDRTRTLFGALPSRARSALGHLAHTDGEIALLNDSAMGIENPPEPNAAQGAWALEQAGLFGYRDDAHYLIIDAGSLGPDYLPGHAHAGTFSFEWSVFGQRVFVDAGVHDYERSALRRYVRSTRAHNTLEIDGHDQAEMWSAFRVGRRGRVVDRNWHPDPTGFELSASHTGYIWLPGQPRHHRDFRFSHDAGMTIRDQVKSSRPHESVVRFHLHPDCQVEWPTKTEARISFSGGNLHVRFEGEGTPGEEKSVYCPRFGVKLMNTALTFRMTGTDVRLTTHIHVE